MASFQIFLIPTFFFFFFFLFPNTASSATICEPDTYCSVFKSPTEFPLQLNTPNVVAIQDSISHATTETKQFSLTLIPETSLWNPSITLANQSLLSMTQITALPDGSWTKTSLFRPWALLSIWTLLRHTPAFITIAPPTWPRLSMSFIFRFIASAAITLRSWLLRSQIHRYSSFVD